jgi:ketosteroid isomerase-like protein
MTTETTAGADAGLVRSAGVAENQEQNLSIVRTIYDAVGRGDVAAILDRVTDDVDWSAEAAGHAAPWDGSRAGKTGIASFLSDLATSIEITEFTPHSFAVGDNNVHLLVRSTFRSIATGRQASMTVHHYWRLRDAKVEYFRGSEQTARVFAA